MDKYENCSSFGLVYQRIPGMSYPCPLREIELIPKILILNLFLWPDPITNCPTMRITSTFLICLLSSYFLYGQTPNIDWQYTTGAPAFGSAAAADVDKDGKLELCFSTYTNDGRLHCLNAEDGSVHWIKDILGCGDVAPIIYDVDLDDTLDVIVNGSCNPTIYCFNGVTGREQWSVASGGGDSPPTIHDIDGDSLPEILFGNFSGEVRILNGEDGSLAKAIQVDNNPIQTEPSLADVNFDGNMDIIVANYINDDGFHIYAYDYNSASIIWQRDDTSSASFHAYHAGAIADLDLDDTLEYVVGRNDGSVIAVNIEDGSELWKVTGLTNVISAVTVADLDGDSVPEVVYSNNDYINFNDHIGILSGLDGSLEWSYPTTFSSFRGVAISDLNGNGQLDLVSGHFLSRVRAIEAYNGLLWEINLGNHLPSGLPYHEADHGPIIADFDDDGNMEVFVVAGYGTYTPDSQNTGIAFALDGGTGGYCPEWLMFRQDIKRSGYMSPADEAESCDTTMTALEDEIPLELNVYPNPTWGRVVVEGDISEDQAKLMVIDIQGRILFSETVESVNGRLRKLLDLEELGLVPGLYGVIVETQNRREVIKVILNPN